MARSLLEIILTVKDKNAKKELGKVDRQLKNVDKSAQKSSKGIKSFDKNLAFLAGGAGLAAAGIVTLGKAIWNLGKRGATIEQTGESFDFLLKKLDLAPDLLDQLSEASRGTVDDMTLMSSVQTLLAGTSDELGKRMGDLTPKLLEIAKAANKLNPSLGDTAFMYQSIATGIKRAQPLILDNLGLTIKVGEANETMAKSLGKSVEDLTAEEKAMAILNDTMRAGDLLIAQVGGNIDAAGDKIARAEVDIKELKDEWALLLSGPVSDTASALTDAINKINKLRDAVRTLDGAYFDGIITLEEWTDIRLKQQQGEVDAAWVTRKLEQETRNWRAEMGLLDFQLVELTGHERAYIGTVDEAGEVMEDAAEGSDSLTEALKRLEDGTGTALDKMRELTETRIKDFFNVDLGVGNLAAQLFDITQFKDLGGEALEALVKEVQLGLVQNRLTTDQARAFFQSIAIEAEAIKIQMGEIDASEAAESITKDFNIPIAESRELIDSVLEGIDLVNSADISAITEDFVAIEERKARLLEAGEIPLEADPDTKAEMALDGLQEQVDILTATPWTINFEIITKGNLPAGAEAFVTARGVAEGGQHGVDYVVPPGFPNDSYLQPVSSGEHVQVTPAGQSAQGSGNYTQYVTQVFNDEGAAALGLAVVRKFGRDRLNYGMGR